MEKKKRFVSEIRNFYWEDPFLFKYYPDLIIRKCVPNEAIGNVLSMCHMNAYGGHFSTKNSTLKILYSCVYWPGIFKGAYAYCKAHQSCQRMDSISMKHKMPLNPIITIEIFLLLEIDFIVSFPYISRFSIHPSGGRVCFKMYKGHTHQNQ